MPPTEMQAMEMDMVEGMYDSYELISMDPPTYSVILAASVDDPPELRVTIIYDNEEYPETAAPTVQLEHIAKHHRVQTATLSKEIADLCEEHIGMHSVISVLQKVQDYLVDHAATEEKAELYRRGEALANSASGAFGAVVAAPDPTVHIGTAVTRELFDEWNRRHMAEKLRTRTSVEKSTTTKLTGRQLWDGTLKSADWELFQGSDDEQEVDFYSLVHDDEEGEEMEFDLDDPEEE